MNWSSKDEQEFLSRGRTQAFQANETKQAKAQRCRRRGGSGDGNDAAELRHGIWGAAGAASLKGSPVASFISSLGISFFHPARRPLLSGSYESGTGQERSQPDPGRPDSSFSRMLRTGGGFHPHQLARGFKEVSAELESPCTPQLFKCRSEFLLRSQKA